MSRASDLANQLMGTCDSIGDEMDDFTEEELAEFDSMVFECTACNWWYDVENMSDDGETCTECAELAGP